MATKEFNTRITHKHDTEAHWVLAENFSPLQGEIIIYDEDENNLSKRFKIGDGETNVNDLPFISAGGIYVGSGPMPDGYNIQIDPNGVVDTGANGKSAYEIAQDHGYGGTEEEWLNSLDGNGTWEHIETVALEDPIREYILTLPANKYKEVYIEGVWTIATDATSASTQQFIIGRQGVIINRRDVSVSNGSKLYYRAYGFLSPKGTMIFDVAISPYYYTSGTLSRNAGDYGTLTFDYFKEIHIWTGNSTHKFGAGSTFEAWGR